MVREDHNRRILPPDALAQKLVLLARRRRDIQSELFDAGYAKPTQWVQDRVRESAQRPEDLENLDQYYDECAAERLGALAGPVNIPTGLFPPVYAYRSAMLDQLRELAAPRLQHGRSFELHPVVLRFVEERRFVPRDAWLAAYGQTDTTVELKLQQPFLSGTRSSSPPWKEAVQNIVHKLGTGYRVKTSTKYYCAIGKTFSNKALSFGLTIQSMSALEGGALQPAFAIWDADHFLKKHIGPLTKYRAMFPPDALVPCYRWTDVFGNFVPGGYEHSISSLAALTRIIDRHLQDILSQDAS
jgi:hypothetical protein